MVAPIAFEHGMLADVNVSIPPLRHFLKAAPVWSRFSMASSRNKGGHLVFTMSRNVLATTSISLGLYHRSDSVSFEVLWNVFDISMHYLDVDVEAFAVNAFALSVPIF